MSEAEAIMTSSGLAVAARASQPLKHPVSDYQGEPVWDAPEWSITRQPPTCGRIVYVSRKDLGPFPAIVVSSQRAKDGRWIAELDVRWGGKMQGKALPADQCLDVPVYDSDPRYQSAEGEVVCNCNGLWAMWPPREKSLMTYDTYKERLGAADRHRVDGELVYRDPDRWIVGVDTSSSEANNSVDKQTADVRMSHTFVPDGSASATTEAPAAHPAASDSHPPQADAPVPQTSDPVPATAETDPVFDRAPAVIEDKPAQPN